MNILVPDSWLREYLDTDATPSEIKEYLSLCGPSVERVNKVGNDYIYEIEITSNRVDMASVFGIAREAAAILPRFGKKARLISPGRSPFGHLPGATDPKNTSGVTRKGSPDGGGNKLEVVDTDRLCYRLLAVVFDDIKIGPSPSFIKDRLEKSGVRSLNNVIDITNYVMLELGHPCHAFDYDRIQTHKLILRRAKSGEKLVTLDNKECLLETNDVIIDDGTRRVIDLPGIMGTSNSVVTEETKRIVFFIESNNPLNIRKTSMRLALRSMAATINEKHPDPELAHVALLRGIELYQKISGAKIASNIIDIYPNPQKPVKIKTTVEFINERLGIKLEVHEIVNILKSLNFEVAIKTPLLEITPPSFRQFDVTIPEDIVEEAARIFGYHNLPNKLMTGEIPVTDKPKILAFEEKIKQILKYWGHTEVYNYSFISKELIEKAHLKTSDYLKVANPLTSDIEYMRISLIPSMLETIAKNQHYSDNLQLFEMANVYLHRKNELPLEIPILAISNQKDFYILKGIVEKLLEEIGISNYNFIVIPSKVEGSSDRRERHFFHPQQSVSFVKNGLNLGFVGKIHPTLAQNFQLKNDLYLAILNVELISKYAKSLKHFVPICPYPAVIEDLTLDFPPRSYLSPVIDEIYKINPLVKNVEVLDRYQNSITLRITYQDTQKNLEGEVVQKIRTNILKNLKSKFNCTLKE